MTMKKRMKLAHDFHEEVTGAANKYHLTPDEVLIVFFIFIEGIFTRAGSRDDKLTVIGTATCLMARAVSAAMDGEGTQ